MKKAYNVYKIYGKADIGRLVKAFSLALVFSVSFLGFQSQTMAQAAYPDAINPSALSSQDILDVYSEYDLDVTMEQAVTRMKTYEPTIRIGDQNDDAVAEVEYMAAKQFMLGISVRLDAGSSVTDAVLASRFDVLNSDYVTNNNLPGVRFDKALEAVMDAISN